MTATPPVTRARRAARGLSRRLVRPPLRLRRRLAPPARIAILLAIVGPGLVSGFADNDAGGITTYSVVGAQFGYALLWVVLASQIALMVTQEAGVRLGLATGQGLSGLVRQRFGIRWAAFAVATMLAANLGDTLAEFAGITAALSLFGVPPWISAVVAALAMVLLLARGSFSRVQLIFVAAGVGVSLAYLISAVLARPDWGQAAVSLVVPHGTLSAVYLLAVVGTIGTTITPWGQAFIQSYAVDKGLRREDLWGSRLDVTLGALLTNLVAALIVIACAATLWSHGDRSIPDAAAAARALGPLAGRAAEVLFGVGLLAASLLGLGTVPLTSAYAACEAFGWESGLSWRPREAPAFYAVLAIFVAVPALIVLIPGLPLIAVMFLSQVFDGLLLPIILVFVMLLARDRGLMGDLRSGSFLTGLGWVVTVGIGVLSVALVVSPLLGL